LGYHIEWINLTFSQQGANLFGRDGTESFIVFEDEPPRRQNVPFHT
jgi:hypothetical protein